ncbi:MBL fold metallo-hydrolase [Microvirgula aerodenitrificans]|uniref:MBL fold metallo-hydrolase n=1 Tax=Microvirgula aerodenitrificans TaxID=57480 RepID=UPI002F3F1A61
MGDRIVPVTAFAQNCSILWCDATREAAVVDPGGDVDTLLATIDALDVKVTRVLLTHGHLDHVGAAAALATALDVPILGPHRADEYWLTGLPQQAEMFGFPPAEALTPDRWLEEGDRIRVGERTLDVLHCPGHTPGHVVFVDREATRAWVGDVLFAGSVGRTDFPGGNQDDLVASIRGKLFPLGDDIGFVPGHGPESTFGDERRHNPFVADKRFG